MLSLIVPDKKTTILKLKAVSRLQFSDRMQNRIDSHLDAYPETQEKLVWVRKSQSPSGDGVLQLGFQTTLWMLVSDWTE